MSDERAGGNDSLMLIMLVGAVGLLLGIGLLRNVIAPRLVPVAHVLASVSGWVPGLGDNAARVVAVATDPVRRSKLRTDTTATVSFLEDSGALLLPWLMLIAGSTAVWVVRRSPRLRYSRTLDLEGLLEIQGHTFPRVRPILWLAGRMKDSERGPFTKMQSPWEWSVRQGVIDPAAADASKTWIAAKARTGFAAQLSTELRPHHRWLVAAFGSIALEERSGSGFTGDRLLDGLAAAFRVWPRGVSRWVFGMKQRLGFWSWANWKGPVEFSFDVSHEFHGELEAAFERVIRSELWKHVEALHTHTESRLVALLAKSQERVAQPPAGFLWVKAVDRTLWYALHGVGMLPATAESAGIRAHMQAEEISGKAIPEADVQGAVNALWMELRADGWKPPKGLDLSESA